MSVAAVYEAISNVWIVSDVGIGEGRNKCREIAPHTVSRPAIMILRISSFSTLETAGNIQSEYKVHPENQELEHDSVLESFVVRTK